MNEPSKSKYKLIAVPVDEDLEVELPDNAVVLNAMYNPESTELCIIALVEKVISKSESESESEEESEDEESNKDESENEESEDEESDEDEDK